MTFKSVNLIESVKTGEVVARKDAAGNFVYSASTEPAAGAHPDAREIEQNLIQDRLWRWLARFRK